VPCLAVLRPAVQDIVHEDLTVRENLAYSARLRLSASKPASEKAALVEDCIDLLQLRHVQHQVVGNVERRGIRWVCVGVLGVVWCAVGMRVWVSAGRCGQRRACAALVATGWEQRNCTAPSLPVPCSLHLPCLLQRRPAQACQHWG